LNEARFSRDRLVPPMQRLPFGHDNPAATDHRPR
jgi:hypothetical protein